MEAISTPRVPAVRIHTGIIVFRSMNRHTQRIVDCSHMRSGLTGANGPILHTQNLTLAR